MDDADAAQRQQDEITALSAIFGDALTLDPLVPTSFSLRVGSEPRTAELEVDFASQYPYQPPKLSVSSPSASASELAAWRAELERLAIEACSEGGRECVANRAQHLSGQLGQATPPPPARDDAAAEEDEAPIDEVVLLIDHMNAPAAYQKLLRRWASSLGLGVRVLAGSAAAGGGGGTASGVARRVHVVIHGSAAGVSSFLQRLRTENVDVDRQGKPCRERRSTVLCRRSLGSDRARLDGWGVSEYATEAEMEGLLDALGVLHVGGAESRWATARAADGAADGAAVKPAVASAVAREEEEEGALQEGCSPAASADDLDGALLAVIPDSLAHLHGAVRGCTLDGLGALERPALLRELKNLGVSKLDERQKLANAIAKGLKAARSPAPAPAVGGSAASRGRRDEPEPQGFSIYCHNTTLADGTQLSNSDPAPEFIVAALEERTGIARPADASTCSLHRLNLHFMGVHAGPGEAAAAPETNLT